MLYSGDSLLTAYHLSRANRPANDNHHRVNDNASADDVLARGTYRVIQATGRLIERTLVRNLS